ncbi:MAG: helix-hairpin-helix domain-containing protein [Saprospiraceae bacterium]|nr:helix-hairpin-helix domain-containing protein [Saprospiraceae bacterium]
MQYNKKERRLILSLLVLCSANILIKQQFINSSESTFPQSDSTQIAQVKKWDKKDTMIMPTVLKSSSNKQETRKNSTKVNDKSLDKINPNTADYKSLLEVGFTPVLAKTLMSFRKYKNLDTQEDILSIYGVDSAFYQSIKHRLIIKPEKPPVKRICINSADTSLLKTIKGIGSVYASRIVKYRNRLGTYVHINQILEVYGIREETFKKIKTYITIEKKATPLCIHSNYDQFIQHPYFPRDKRETISNFIYQHKPASYKELIHPAYLSPEDTLKLNRYFSFTSCH